MASREFDHPHRLFTVILEGLGHLDLPIPTIGVEIEIDRLHMAAVEMLDILFFKRPFALNGPRTDSFIDSLQAGTGIRRTFMQDHVVDEDRTPLEKTMWAFIMPAL